MRINDYAKGTVNKIAELINISLNFNIGYNSLNAQKSTCFRKCSGASRRTRTYNPSVNSRMLCHWAIEAFWKANQWSALHMESGGDLSSRAVSSQVLSTLKGLTSVFGMGTGGTPSPLPPEIFHFQLGWGETHRETCPRLIISSLSTEVNNYFADPHQVIIACFAFTYC